MSEHCAACAWGRFQFVAFDDQTPDPDRCAGWECHSRRGACKTNRTPPHPAAVERGTSNTAKRAGVPLPKKPPPTYVKRLDPATRDEEGNSFCEDDSPEPSVIPVDERSLTWWVEIETGEYVIWLGYDFPGGPNWMLLNTMFNAGRFGSDSEL